MTYHYSNENLAHASDPPDHFLRLARNMTPMLREAADEISRRRTLPKPVFDKMREAGFFRILQPKRFGGHELSPGVLYDAQIAIAEGDMSAGWLCGVMGVSPFHLALLDDRAQRDVWEKTPDAVIASAYTPTGRAVRDGEGFRLSGRWGFASGCDHCDWAFFGALVEEAGDAPPQPHVFLLPRADFEIIDTWHVNGLRGTGSKDIVIDEVVVPAYRTIRVSDRFEGKTPGLNGEAPSLYNIPFLQLQFRAISSASIGALKSMLDHFIGNNRKRVTALGAKAASDPVAQLTCGETLAALHEMTVMLHQNVDAMMQDAMKGRAPSIEDRQLYRLHSTLTPERCCQLGARIFKSSGGAALREDSPLGRILADLNAGRQHAANQYQVHGRSLGAMQMGATQTGAAQNDMIL